MNVSVATQLSKALSPRVFTLYSKSLPLDLASRVWDVYFRDGDSFLFATALGKCEGLGEAVRAVGEAVRAVGGGSKGGGGRQCRRLLLIQYSPLRSVSVGGWGEAVRAVGEAVRAVGGGSEGGGGRQ